MIGSEKPPASGAARGSLVRSVRERALKVVAALFVATAFVLMGAPTATAAPALMDNHTPSSIVPPCRGDRPGFCPGPATVQSHEQTATDSHEQLTEDQLPEL